MLSARSFVLVVVVTPAVLNRAIQDYQARNCPGDPKRGIPLRNGRPIAVTSTHTVAFISTVPPGF